MKAPTQYTECMYHADGVTSCVIYVIYIYTWYHLLTLYNAKKIYAIIKFNRIAILQLFSLINYFYYMLV